MVTLEIYKTNTVLPELYGKIQLDGNRIVTEGTSSVFELFLEKGITSDDNTVLHPQEGTCYLDRLKQYLKNQGFIVHSSSSAVMV